VFPRLQGPGAPLAAQYQAHCPFSCPLCCVVVTYRSFIPILLSTHWMIRPCCLSSEVICSCARLKFSTYLQCTPLDFAAWKHLPNLPTPLTVIIYEGLHQVLLDSDNVDFALFLHVTTLCFSVVSAADIMTVIRRHLKSPSLKVSVHHLCRHSALCRALSCIENSADDVRPLER